MTMEPHRRPKLGIRKKTKRLLSLVGIRLRVAGMKIGTPHKGLDLSAETEGFRTAIFVPNFNQIINYCKAGAAPFLEGVTGLWSGLVGSTTIWATLCRTAAGTRGQVTVNTPSWTPAVTSACYQRGKMSQNNSK